MVSLKEMSRGVDGGIDKPPKKIGDATRRTKL